jgi:hypothetical protein
MSLEIFIPLQNLDINNVHIHPPTSTYPLRIPTSLLSYSNSLCTIPKISVLTDSFFVHNWDPIKGKLELVEPKQVHSFKNIIALQELVIQKLIENPSWSSFTKYNNEDIQARFQYPIYNNIFTLFLNNKGPEGIFIHSADGSKKLTLTSTVPEKLFHQGQRLRIALRFQGLVFLKNTNSKLFYRLQHQIAHIYCS